MLAKGLLGVSLLLAGPVQAGNKDWDDASAIVVDALVVTALSVPVAKGDWDGALHSSLRKARPMRSNRHSRNGSPIARIATAFLRVIPSLPSPRQQRWRIDMDGRPGCLPMPHDDAELHS